MSGRIVEVDGLRAVAMSMVVAQHCGLMPFGWAGVWLFFVISGFVIQRGFLADEGRFASPAAHWRDFMWRRAARIVPVYALYLAINALLLVGVDGWQRLGDLPWLASFTYNWHMAFGLPGGSTAWTPFGHLWTLSVEEQFYLLFPLLALWAPPRWRLRSIGALVLAGPLLRWVCSQALAGAAHDDAWRAFAIYAASVCHADAFLVGALLAHAAARPGLLERLRAPLLVLAPMGLLLHAGVYVGLHLTMGLRGLDALRNVYSGVLYGQGREIWVYVAVDLAAAAVLVAALTRCRGTAWLGHPWLARVGQVSYGAYLFHALVLWLIGRIMLPVGLGAESPVALRLARFAVAWPVTVATAWLCFHYIEAPVRRRLLARLAQHPPTGRLNAAPVVGASGARG